MTLHAASLAALLVACGEVDDLVFVPLGVVPDSVTVSEGAGVVEIPLRLSGDHRERVVAHVRAVPAEAQNDCQVPDFDAAERTVEWPPGTNEVTVSVFIGEDDLAEIDERFVLEIDPVQGLASKHNVGIGVTILDNDRTALLDAAEGGVLPGQSSDAAAALQAVFDQAATLGRAVIAMQAGTYEVSSVLVPPGVTLSARGVEWLRPRESAADVISLRLEQTGPGDAAPSLVEGLALNGRREEQGPYRDHERQGAHLIALRGDAEAGGRVLATLEGLDLSSGTASGVNVGPEADLTLCRLSANELWRDAITAMGGGSTVRIRGVDATSSEGTGLWVGVRENGFEDSQVLNVEIEDVVIGAGDVEIETTNGSSVVVRRLTMTRPPFRLDGLDGSVRIADSVLMTGVPSNVHDHFGLPHDVEITGTTLVVSEVPFEEDAGEAARTFAAVSTTASVPSPLPAASGPGRILIDGCRFETAGKLEADDVVYAVDNTLEDVSVTVQNSTLGRGFTDWFSPECVSCTREP